MIEVKGKWISLDGIRTMEFVEAYKSNDHHCQIAITYAFDDTKTYIDLEEGYNEYIEITQMIADTINSK